jgi:hypothetical protein
VAHNDAQWGTGEYRLLEPNQGLMFSPTALSI